MVEFEKFLQEQKEKLPEDHPHRAYFDAQIELLKDENTRPNDFQRRLITKIIKTGPKSWTPKKLPEPEAIRELPRILYWMYGHDEDPKARENSYFKKGILNESGKLIHFTQRPIEAAQYLGTGLKVPGIAGRLVVILFPYETTNLGKWVEDPAAHHNLPGTRIFLTDQRIRRENTLLVEYTRIVNAYPPNKAKNIMEFQIGYGKKPPVLPEEKQTREVVEEMFDITDIYQKNLTQFFW